MKEVSSELMRILRGAVTSGGMLRATDKTHNACVALNKLGYLITDAATLVGRPRSYFVTTEGIEAVRQEDEKGNARQDV